MEITVNIQSIDITIKEADDAGLEDLEGMTGENVTYHATPCGSDFNPYQYAATKEAYEGLGNLEQAVMYDNGSADFNKTKVVLFLDEDSTSILDNLATIHDVSLSAIVVGLLKAAMDEEMETAYDKAVDINFPHPEADGVECDGGFCQRTNSVQQVSNIADEAEKEGF